MPLNVVNFNDLNNQIANISRVIQQVELFLTGQPINTARIDDAVIISANIVDLSVVNSKFADLAITNVKITSVDAGKLTTGTLNADRIAAGTITADKLDVTDLSAITADVGNMTGGSINGNTITGGTIRTESSGTRVELSASPNALRWFGGSDVDILIDSSGININNSDNISFFVVDSSLNIRSQFFTFNSGADSFTMIRSNDVDDFLIGNTTSGGDLHIVSADDAIDLDPPGDIYVNGSLKTAIVPTLDDGYRALYCLESPEVWFFDFVKDVNKLDAMFSEATIGEINAIKTDQGEYLVFRRRQGHENKRFEKKNFEQFDRNRKFWGQL